jgi:hypothetical protein
MTEPFQGIGLVNAVNAVKDPTGCDQHSFAMSAKEKEA